MDLKLPHLGEGADSGTVVNLFVKEGDSIAQGQPVLELENEKAVATIPASAAGTVGKIFVKPGDKIGVGQKILTFKGGAAPARPSPAPAREPEPEAEPERSPSSSTVAAGPASAAAAESVASSAPPAASPAIRKLARDLGIDLNRVRGSARGGRIEMADVRDYIQRLQRLASQPAPASGAPAPKPAPPQIDFSKWGPVTLKPLTPLRAVIARRMTENWATIPHVTQFDDIDVTAVMALRKKHAAAYEAKGARLTVTTLVLKAVADTLKKHPVFNASLDEAANQVVFKDYIHLGIAVDTEAGLIVPVLRDVDKMSLLELSKELEALATRARERKVTAEELKGGTFTISNQGAIGGAHFTPIINKPEVAILGLGRAAAAPVVREGKIEMRTLMPVGLSYDHRIIDGGSAARFVVDLSQAIERFDEGRLKLKS